MKKSIKCPPQIIHNFKGTYISLGFTLNLNVENWKLVVLLTLEGRARDSNFD